jgi:hypothetical protein
MVVKLNQIKNQMMLGFTSHHPKWAIAYKFKAIEIVKFKYKDQTHDDFNIGVIAQQVETVAPEFIEAEDWGKDTPAQSEEPLKSVYTSDLYHASIKVLQECMSKIEEQQTQIESLKAEIQTLKQ